MLDPALRHYKAAQQCLAHLLVTKDYSQTYTKHAICGIHDHIVAPGVLEVFSDASFTKCMLTCEPPHNHLPPDCLWGRHCLP